MNLSDLNREFSTEDKCREFLKRLPWPEGVTCPRCKSKTISRLFTQSKFECADCRYQFSVTAGTVFNGTWHKVSAKHLPAYLEEMCFRFNRRKRPDFVSRYFASYGYGPGAHL